MQRPASSDTAHSAIAVQGLSKIYNNGFAALNNVDLDVRRGEIFALLGPNGAGKSTLINTICGIVQPTSGKVTVCGHDHMTGYRAARAAIGLVPQELTTDAFESVWNTVSFSRGLFGRPANPAYIEDVLKRLSLWDKKDAQIRHLSGGMKRRVMMAKALAHEPQVLFLDEPTAGVDVELRKSMWAEVRQMRESGVTIVLTTHYLEEAEEMADRVGIIHKGELMLTEDKDVLMQRMGDRQMIFWLERPMPMLPSSLARFNMAVRDEGSRLVLTYGSHDRPFSVDELLAAMRAEGLVLRDIETRQSNLEKIFMELVKER